jgi:hypothetical protein
MSGYFVRACKFLDISITFESLVFLHANALQGLSALGIKNSCLVYLEFKLPMSHNKLKSIAFPGYVISKHLHAFAVLESDIYKFSV